MFQAHAWGLPHGAALVGADLVLPGHGLSAPAVGELIRCHQVTMIAGGPTALGELLEHTDAAPGILDSLRLVVSALRGLLADGFAGHGVEVVQAWGTTETCRCLTTPQPPRSANDSLTNRWGPAGAAP
jgi:fatty-acyl-CoA synthase